MRIELYDEQRQYLGRIEVDPAERPTRVVTTDTGIEEFLTWEAALDDAGHLRRCVACGCQGLYKAKAFPQVTMLVVVLAFAGAVIAVLGYATNPYILASMVVVLIMDIGILIFSRPRLVCYRCHTRYSRLPFARFNRKWDKATAERYQPIRDTTEPRHESIAKRARARQDINGEPTREGASL